LRRRDPTAHDGAAAAGDIAVVCRMVQSNRVNRSDGEEERRDRDENQQKSSGNPEQSDIQVHQSVPM
jgi:hypothetical protein